MQINPVAFTIFGIEVMWYGILIAIGALSAITIANKLGKREGFKEDIIYDYAMIALLLGVVGARAYYVIFNLDYYMQHTSEILAIRNGGLAIYGGIITGVIVGIVYTKIKGIKFFKLADVIAPGLALAQGIGRWGNFVNQEAHGAPTDVTWGIMIDGVKVHPTFLYESILDVGIFIFLYFFLYNKKKFEGQIFATYGMIYGLGRFVIEGMRTDSLYFGGMRVSQIVSLLIVLVSASFIMYSKRKAK
ncbi:Prolipoprotein diacylglyceryl transferase [Peptoniphilus asaccharolyticus DSM 20463]|uniref:Phosphatidylglycerol--prolipoprotein diacylglyceryl transferase n=1 Tax=Peptoniphilus asaccharolyticus DSM 20463 TaxID=573058 RepID=A0A1W1UKD9_PEPAS|nr:prolipoprotein diacylglyceryl transferase [Peptoniphilus asaccharolyticus]MBL7574847.1 prolipoprotein diacylglyceryl transferase [Peptoniphilus asaccharolyticus]SMB81566.1 Prolipoprotein diacylglyceryl transferase [Peptoniphilus asaccharolyticus DSM 20463]